MKTALIVQGGWGGHQPKEVAEILGALLREERFAVEISDTLDSFLDEEKLCSLDLIVPIWTMGSITQEQLRPLLHAVRSGVGLAGCHGGMGDSFRNETEYQFMVDGQWVAHPGNDGVTSIRRFRSWPRHRSGMWRCLLYGPKRTEPAMYFTVHWDIRPVL